MKSEKGVTLNCKGKYLEANPDENERTCRDEEENTNGCAKKGWNKSRNRNTKNEIIKIY